jgi:hypothetical protein
MSEGETVGTDLPATWEAATAAATAALITFEASSKAS